jgi:hypothetical protein
MMEKYIISILFFKIIFWKKKNEFILSMWKLTLGYGIKGKGLGAGHSGPNLRSVPP